MSSFWMPKKQPLYAPMIASFGGGSARGYGRGYVSNGGWDYSLNPVDIAGATWSSMFSDASVPSCIGMAVEPNGRRVHITSYGEDALVTITNLSSGEWPKTGWTGYARDTDWLPGLSGANGNYGHVTYWDDGNRAALLSVDGGDYFDLTLSTPYDLRSVTSVGNIDTTFIQSGTVPSGSGGGWVFLDNSGTRAIVKGYNGANTIYRAEVSTPGAIGASTVSWENTGLLTAFSIGGACMSPDHRFIYDVSYSNGKVYRVDAGSGKSLFTSSTISVDNSDTTSIPYGSLGTLNIDWENLAGLEGKRRAFLWSNAARNLLYADINLPV